MKGIYFISTILGFIACLMYASIANGQSIPVGTPVIEDYYRRAQLLGEVDSNYSFSIRPFYPDAKFKKNIYDPDSSLKNDSWSSAGPISFAKGLGSFQLLPLHIQQQFNSHHPYGWNDEAIIPAKGYQSMISGGFYIKLGLLSIQLRPEYVYAANPDFAGSQRVVYSMDLPTRFGNTPYNQLSWGQSNIRLTTGPVSLGLSNESIWWGPGIKNSIILSNNAPGFKHITFNTVRPIKSFLGYFEGQIIAARLEPSGLQPLSAEIGPKDWRYFTGFNLNYHPKWVPGLTLGLTRTFSAYSQYVNKFSHYVPYFYPYQKASVNNGEDPIPRDQLTSLYARWLFVNAKAEVYFEYGINDNSYDMRQFITRPDLTRTYQFGFRKMVSLNDKNKHILFGAEITQMSQSTDDRIVDNTHGSWYTHYQVISGHTNKGQILGAGIGPGGNSQSIDISWVYGLKRVGISFDRYEHDVDVTPENINGYSRKWVDFAFGLQGDWNYKNLIVSAKLQHIKSLNYQWILKDYVPGQYYIPHNDVYNFHGQLGLIYRF